MIVAKVVWIFLFFELGRTQFTTLPGITNSPEISNLPFSVSKEPIYSISTTSATTSTPAISPTSSTTPASTISSTTISSSTISSTTTSSSTTSSTTISSTTASPNPPSHATSPFSPVTTPKPIRNFTILLVFQNLTDKVPNLLEINDNVANTLKSSLATKLGVDNASISNSSDIQLTNGGKPVKIVKRSADPPPNNDVTLLFDLTTDKYNTADEVAKKIKSSGPFEIFNLTASDPIVYVWTDIDRCPSQNCSSGTTCTVTSNSTNPKIYHLNCSPVTQLNTPTSNPGPNLLYLLLLLLLIPIAILIAIGCYCYHRNPGRIHLVNSYPNEKLQAKFSNFSFGTTKSVKSDIMIMGGEGPPTYETNPKSAVKTQSSKVGTVASIHAFDNQAFNEQEKDYANANGVVSNHPPVEGDNSMTFSYMQMRNSKVKDDTMALF